MSASWHSQRFEPHPSRTRVDCVVCERQMWFPPSKAGLYETCSTECRHKRTADTFRERERPCETCGRVFLPRATQIRDGIGRYCSQACNTAGVASFRTPEALKKARESWSRGYREGRIKPATGPRVGNWRGGRTVSGGYVVLAKSLSAKGKVEQEHRVVMEATLGRVLRSDEIIHHKNHNRTDNRIENLEIMTRAEHMREHWPEIRAGWCAPKGEQSGNAKLTEQLVREIRSSSESATAWALRLGVSVAAVCYARKGDTWRHVR